MPVYEFTYPSETGLHDIHAELFVPEKTPWVILQLAHGMAEHIGRYEGFARYLSERGVLVAMHDHAGHGKSCADGSQPGYFAPTGGCDAVLQDMKALNDRVKADYPGIPLVLMGHSMGSFFARAYAARYPEDISGCIFSGTAGKNPAIHAGRIVARMEQRKNGPRKPSERLHKLSFGSYNKKFAPVQTASDWLTRDAAIVNEYEKDPMCGFPFTAEGMRDVFQVMQEVSAKDWAARVPRVPILLFSGDHDPVGNYGKGVRQVYDWLQETGHTVTFLLYPEGRHEMLNELNKNEVYRAIHGFLAAYFLPGF